MKKETLSYTQIQGEKERQTEVKKEEGESEREKQGEKGLAFGFPSSFINALFDFQTLKRVPHGKWVPYVGLFLGEHVQQLSSAQRHGHFSSWLRGPRACALTIQTKDVQSLKALHSATFRATWGPHKNKGQMKPDVVHTLASLLFTYLMFGIKSQRYGVKSDSEHKPTFILLQRKTTFYIIHFG